MADQPFVHVIDDDPSVRESLKALLGSGGYSAQCYPGGQAFLRHAGEVTGCALVDLRMPDMDGLALQSEIIARNIPVTIIMLSAYGDIEQAVTAMRRGAADFVEKPFDPDQLLRKIDTVAAAGGDIASAQREARQDAARLATLTDREKQILALVVDGLSNKEVGAELGISPRTVETHRVHVMQKLEAKSLPDLVRIWLNARRGEVPVV